MTPKESENKRLWNMLHHQPDLQNTVIKNSPNWPGTIRVMDETREQLQLDLLTKNKRSMCKTLRTIDGRSSMRR